MLVILFVSTEYFAGETTRRRPHQTPAKSLPTTVNEGAVGTAAVNGSVSDIPLKTLTICINVHCKMYTHIAVSIHHRYSTGVLYTKYSRVKM